MNDPLYLSAKEAATELGISVSTLYAYVSRKNIRSVQVDGSRKRLYFRSDVERLKSTKRAGPQSSAGPVMVTETKISLLTEDGLFYRGKNSVSLAECASLEETAEWLWDVPAGSAFTDSMPSLPADYQALHKQIRTLPTTEQACILLPFVKNANPRSYNLSRQGLVRTGADITRLFASIVCRIDKPSPTPIHELVADKLRAPAGFDDIIRRLLVLFADHELSPSTFAVRTLANTGANPYHIVAAGIMCYKGQRLIDVRFDRTNRILQEILTERDPAEPIIRRFKIGESIEGFEAGLHQTHDPRSTHMIQAMSQQLGDDEQFQRLAVAVRTAKELADLNPDLTLITAFVGQKLGITNDFIQIAALGRIAGWIAHASEQFHDHQLFRPRADYVGNLPHCP